MSVLRLRSSYHEIPTKIWSQNRDMRKIEFPRAASWEKLLDSSHRVEIDVNWVSRILYMELPVLTKLKQQVKRIIGDQRVHMDVVSPFRLQHTEDLCCKGLGLIGMMQDTVRVNVIKRRSWKRNEACISIAYAGHIAASLFR